MDVGTCQLPIRHAMVEIDGTVVTKVHPPQLSHEVPFLLIKELSSSPNWRHEQIIYIQ
jgi:hypothetical protein